MKLVRKWLFPALTCLIVLGAAALPARLSQMRDARQFGQVHTEALEADGLPVAQPPTLLDRMELYAGQNDASHPVLSFRDAVYFEDSEGRELADTAQALLTGAGVLPRWLFREEPFDQVTVGRELLWDPAEESAAQEPAQFWTVHWSYYSNKYHTESIELVLDAETGLPIKLFIDDTNMSQWLAYDQEALRALAERFFDLLGVGVREVEAHGPMYDPSLNLSYAVDGTSLHFHISRAPTALVVQLERVGDWTDASDVTDADR